MMIRGSNQFSLVNGVFQHICDFIIKNYAVNTPIKLEIRNGFKMMNNRCEERDILIIINFVENHAQTKVCKNDYFGKILFLL